MEPEVSPMEPVVDEAPFAIDESWDDAAVDAYDPYDGLDLGQGDDGATGYPEDPAVYDDVAVEPAGYDALDEDNFYGIVW